MNQVIIRKASLEDREGIHESHMRSIREVCIKDHGKDEVSGWGNRPLGKRWVEPIEKHFVWVVEYKKYIQGHAFLRVDGTIASIHGLYLTPQVLGKGLGNELMELMIEQSRKSKVEIIKLESTITAHGFYLKWGFVDSGPLETSSIGGSLVRGYPMEFKIHTK